MSHRSTTHIHPKMIVPNKVNLGRLSYVIYEHPDLPEFLEFSRDFGFEVTDKPADDGTVYLRGYGTDPFVYIARQAPAGQGKRFYSAGFTARTHDDFERACRLDGARVGDASQRPGGGQMVEIPDVNGYAIQVVYGQENREIPNKGLSRVHDGRPNVNGAITKVRRGELQFSFSLQ